MIHTFISMILTYKHETEVRKGFFLLAYRPNQVTSRKSYIIRKTKTKLPG